MKATSGRWVIGLGVLAAALSACGSGGSDPTAAQGNHCISTTPQGIGKWCGTGGQQLKVAVVLENDQDVYFHSVGVGAQAAGKALGASVDVQAPSQWTTAAEAQTINAVIQTHPDVMIVAPNSPTALTPQLEAAAKSGIVVLTAVQDTSNPKLRWTSLASDDIAQGKALGELVADDASHKGSMAVMASAPGPIVEAHRISGLLSGVKTTGDKLTPLATQYCEGDVGKCASTTNALLQSKSDLAAIVAVGESMGEGVGNAVRTARRSSDVFVASWDAAPAQIHQLAEGAVQALVVSHPYEIGYEAVQIAQQLMTKGAVNTPLVKGVTSPSELPSKVIAKFDIAVKDTSLCPSDKKVPCGSYTDPAISKYFYH